MDDGRPKTMMSASSLGARPSPMEAPAPANDAAPSASSRGAGSRSSQEAFDQAAIRAELRRWIVDHAKVPARELTDRTRLLETGLLSSLDVVELVLFIEELRGEEIDTDDIEPEVFASIDSLWDGFFATRA